MARAGSALGVDISVPAIERARELAEAQGVRNVTFEQADAQVHRFPRERFDLAISRFGTMFFAEPVAAFTNIGRALRPAGRLVMMVWQAHDRNEWDMAIRRSLTGPDGSAAVASAGPDPFSLADPPAVTRILEAAGSPTSPSRTSANPCTSARTWPPPLTGSAASRAPGKHSTAWIPLPPHARSDGCARCSPRTAATRVSGSTPAPGSSPLAASP